MEARKQYKYPDLLKVEVEKELAKLTEEIESLSAQKAAIDSQYDVLKRKCSADGGLGPAEKKTMQQCWKKAGEYNKQINALQKRKKNFANQREEVIARDAHALFGEARDVEKKTGKNKLYIGNRQFVAKYADNKGDKAKRQILNANNWTWGVNFAWIEGGTTAAARIKIKENENGEDPYQMIPQGAYDQMMIDPRMTGGLWLKLCEEYPNTILWHGGDNRPTWTALEIEACLNSGYEFRFREHKHRVGRVIELVKR